MALNIFLSYGHDIVEDATRIYKDLEKAGHTVWFDKIDIGTGDDWLKRIEDGIKKTGFSSNSRFILLISPHIFRDENGWFSITRNEIQAAMDYKIKIFPVMIEFCNAPFILKPYQYLDFRECIPIRDHETEYKSKFKILLHSLNKNTTENFDYFLDQWINDFLYKSTDNKKLSELLEKFTGRQWLVDILNDWLEKDDTHPVFCLQGNMGYGKSAFAAYIIKNHPNVLAYYFIKFSTEAKQKNLKTTLVKAFSHIILQLTSKYPRFWKYLKEHETQNLNAIAATLDPENEKETITLRSLLQELIINPIAKINLEENKRIVVILDALDELKPDERQNLLTLISDNYSTFPKCFRLVLTSRYNPSISRLNYCIKTIDLRKSNSYTENNISDIWIYISNEFRQFNGNADLAPEIIDIIVKKSEGLFLYLFWLIKYLLKQPPSTEITMDNALQFPQGLDEIIIKFFDQEYYDIKFYRDHTSKILEVNFAAQNPLTLNEIITLFNFPEKDSIGCENKLGTLFICSNNEITACHRFVYDWVTNESKAGKYFIDLKKGHTFLAEKGEEALLKIKDKNISDVLGLSQLEKKLIFEIPYHYVSLGKISNLLGVLTEVGLCIHFFNSDLSRFQFLTFLSEVPDPKILIPVYKKRLKKFEKNNKTEVIARGYHVIGLIFFNLSIHIEGEYFFKKAEAFYKRDRNKTKIAHVYNDLGEIYYNQSDKIAESVEDLDELLKKPINRKAKLKRIFNILKVALRVWQLVRKAKSYYEKAIDLRSKVLGKDHPETAESINNLGHAFLNLSKYAKSEAQYTMALEIREKVLSPYHKDIAEGYYNIGMIQTFRYGNDLEKYKKAIENIEKAISINETGSKKYGQERYDLPLYHYMAGYKYKKISEFNKAINHLEKSVILNICFYGVKNKKSVEAFKEYEDTYLNMKKKGIQRNSEHFDLVLLNDSLKKRLRMLPENSPEIILIHNIFAIVLINNGHSSGAEYYIKESHSLVDRILQDPILTDPYKNILVQFYQKYSNLLINQSNYKDALSQIIKAFDICKTMEGGLLNPLTLEVYIYLVKVYLSIDLVKRRKALNLINYMMEMAPQIVGEYMRKDTLISKVGYHHLAIPYNEIAYHTFVPEKKWVDAEKNYKEGIILIKRSEMQDEIANMELNLQVVYFRSGKEVDLDKVKSYIKTLESFNDVRANKGYYIIKAPKREFRKVLLQLFFAVAASDGKIEKCELEYIYKYLDITAYDELFEVCQSFKSQWENQKSNYRQFVDPIVSEAIEITRKNESIQMEIHEIVRQVGFLSAADQHIEQEELDTILQYVKPFGMSKEDIMKIINELH